jgi:hypothetical protein
VRKDTVKNTKSILDPFSRTPATGYPLTEGELITLAEHWWSVALDHRAWWTLSATVGGGEARDHRHALDRLELLAEIVGRGEIERIGKLAEGRLRERLGEELWTAFQEGRPLLQEEAQRRTGPTRRRWWAWWR